MKTQINQINCFDRLFIIIISFVKVFYLLRFLQVVDGYVRV